MEKMSQNIVNKKKVENIVIKSRFSFCLSFLPLPFPQSFLGTDGDGRKA